MAKQIIIIGTDADEHLVAVQAGDIINTDQDAWITLPDHYSIENLMKAGNSLVIQIPGEGLFSIQNFFDHATNPDDIIAHTNLEVHHFAPSLLLNNRDYSSNDISSQLSVGIQLSIANNDFNIEPLQVAPGAKFSFSDIRESTRIAQYSYLGTSLQEADNNQAAFIDAAALLEDDTTHPIAKTTANQSPENNDDSLINDQPHAQNHTSVMQHFSLTANNAVLIQAEETLIIQPQDGTAPVAITHYFTGEKHATDHQAIYDVLDTSTLPSATGQGQKTRFVGMNAAAMLTSAALAAIHPNITIKHIHVEKNHDNDHDQLPLTSKVHYHHIDESAFFTYRSIDEERADTKKAPSEEQAEEAQKNGHDNEANGDSNVNTHANADTKISDNRVTEETTTIESLTTPTIQLFNESLLQTSGDAPTSLDNTFLGTEDQVYALTASDFGFSDNTSQQQVAFTTLPSNGTLQLNGIDIILNQIVNVSSFTNGQLTYQQPADANGSTYDTFGFRVNSGLGFSAEFTLTANIANVNDAPSMNDSHLAALTTITEDDTNNSGQTVASILDDSLSDIDPSAVEGIGITSLDSSNGTWQYQIDGINWVNVGTVSTSEALLLRATDSLRFVPDGQNSDTASVTFIAWDQSNGSAGSKVDASTTGGTTAFSTTSNTSSITVTAVNDAPTASNDNVTIDEDTTYTFLASDFNFSDIDTGDTLQQIKVTSLESAGSLELSDVAVTLNQVISMTDINAGHLKFTPATNANGDSNDSFAFKVYDGSAYSDSAYTMTFDVDPLPDAPNATNNTVTTNEDTTVTFTASDFNFSDPDSGDSLQQIQITSLESVGALELSGVAVTLNQVISIADMNAGHLKFIPVANANGSDYDSFSFKVHDGSTYSASSFTLTINVSAVNDAPTASNNTLTISEESTHTFLASDFNFADIDAGNNLQQIKVTSLESAGALELSGVAVTLNQVITNTDIIAGNLQFTPAANANGNSYDSFYFQVHDGSAFSDSSYTLTFDVTAMQDAPTASNKTVTTDEDATYTFGASDFNFADVDSGDSLQQIQITSLESAGVLELSGTAVTLNQVISIANITAGNLKFIPVADANGASYDNFSFKVHDGTDDSSSAYTMTVDVTAVQDTPTAGNKTVTTNEDSPYTFALNDFNFADVDSADSLQQIQVTSLESVGALELSGIAVTLNQIISAANISAGNLKFIPVANANGSSYDNFSFKVHDGTNYSSSAYTMTVDVTAVNDAPTASNNTIGINEDTAYTLTPSDFGFADIDSGDSLQQVQITTLETAGTLKLSGADVTLNQVISLADINAGNLLFTPATNVNGDSHDSFAFKIHDGTAYSTSAYNVTFDVTAVQDAPTLGNGSLAAIVEGNANPSGESVSTVFSGQFSDPDAGSSFNGVAVISNTANAGTEGAWQYSSDSGSNWLDIGSVADNSTALVLSTSTLVRFVPLENYNGNPPSLSVRGLDNTYGGSFSTTDSEETRVTVDSSNNGGSTAIAGSSASISTAVTLQNDAPVLDNTGSMTLTAINEDATTSSGDSVANIVLSAGGDRITDVDTGSVEGIAITALTSSNGTWQYQLSGGSWTNVGSVADNNALLLRPEDLMRFVPDALNADTASITFRAWDQTTGTEGTKVDATTNGTSTAFSSATETASMTVTAVNDAPNASNNTIATNEDTTVTFTASDFNFTDVDSSDSLQQIQVTTLEAVGALELSGVAVTLNQVISIANINAGNLKFIPVANANGTNYDSFGFKVHDGTAYSSSAFTLTIDVTAVNDAPTAGTNTVSTNEDTAYTFIIGDFNFSDIDGGDSLQQIQVTSLETAGSLEFSGSAVTLNQVITAADITAGNLNFSPAADANGSSYDSFAFKVHDGSAYSTSAYTMTVNVTAVQDAPTAGNKTVTTNEDTTITFSTSDFNFADVDSTDTLQQIQVTSLETSGALELSGAAVTLNQVISVANITAGHLKFIPLADANGTSYDSFSFKVHDGNVYSSSAYTMTVDVTAVNDAPTANNKTIITNEDTTVTFSTNDFNFADVDNADTLQQIQVTSLETAGALELSNTAVTLNQVISVANIAAGNLKFIPAANANGSSYDSFVFKVHDGAVYSSSAYTMTVDVTAVQDAPTAGNKTVTTNEDTTYTFGASDFNFADVDSPDTLQQIQVTSLETTGVLELSGAAVTLNQAISVANITAGNLTFIPVANANGSSYDSFAFKVHDGTAYSSSAYTMTVDVTAVNDAPTAGNKTVTTNEDTTYTFSASDFNFADVDSADTFQQVQVTSLESAGALELSGAAVTLNQVISAANITAGNLKFIPAADANGAGHDSFAFKVHDGSAYSSSAYTMTVDVTAVQDAPTTSASTATATEDTTYTFSVSDFNFADVDSGDSLQQVQITRLERGGSLQLSGTDVTLNQVITVADITAGNLKLVPVADKFGAGYADFTFKVHDGTAYSSSSYEMTMNVTGTNDLPTSSNVTIDVGQNSAYLFKGGSFSFIDGDGTDVITQIKITSLESAGDLEYYVFGWADVALNQVFTISDINAGNLRFTASGSGDGYDSFQFQVHDGTGFSNSSYTTTIDSNAFSTDALWISTNLNVTSGGAPGDGTWGKDSLVEISDPNLATGTTSGGTFSELVNFGALGDGNVNMNAFHYVSQNTTTGGLNLLAGDLLFSTTKDEVFDGVTYNDEDVIYFRPTTAGDYTTGTFGWVLNMGGNVTNDINSIVLVEQSTTVGTTTLNAGDFIFTDENTNENIFRFEVTQAGSTTSGTISTLITSNSVGITSRVTGLSLVETTDADYYGTAITAGNLIATIRNDFGAFVGDNNLFVQDSDLFLLDVTNSTTATASMFYDGSDVNLNPLFEDISAFTLKDYSNSAPTLDNVIADQPSSGTLYAGAVNSFTFNANVFSDPESDALTYTAKLSDNNPLPNWITFDAATRTFTYDPTFSAIGVNTIVVTASDTYSNQTTDTFTLTITDPNNTLDGDDTANTITGTTGADTIYGFAGDDTLRGANGNDTLYGGTGNDYLLGQAGNDTLKGGFGDDNLRGDSGVDTLTGNGGADVFIWNDASHSGIGSGNRDVVADFSQSDLDKIDFTGLGLYYIGSTAFSSTADEVRWSQSGGNTLIEVDSDGNGSADFEIELTGLITLTAADFNGVTSQLSFTLTSGTDNFTGGNTDDIFYSTVANYSTADTLDGAAGTDTLSLSGGGTFATLQSNLSNLETISMADDGSYTLTVHNPSGLQTIDGSALTGSNTLTVNAASATSGLTLTGGAGNDSLTGGLAADTIHGGDGNDIIYGDAQAFTSASIAGLQAWFDASDVSADGSAYAHDTQLTTWVNKISAGPDATTASGNVGVLYKTTSDTLNGRTALDFSSNEGMTLGTGTLGSTGLYSGAGDAFTVFIINDSDVGTTGTLLARAGTTQTLRTFQAINTNVEDSDTATVINGATTYYNETHDDNPYQISYVWDGSSATRYLDGSASTPAVDVGAAAEQTSENITIGARTDGTGYQLDGRIAEILVFDVALSTVDMAIVQNYLAAKYNLATAGVSPGADTLTGGNGADTFTWSNASHSGVGSGNRDIVTDFNEGAGDKIDLSSYLSTTMQLGGNIAFTGTANELIWTQDGANTLVQLDYNGNSTVDFEIQLNDVTASTLTEAAFIFGHVIGTLGADTLTVGDAGYTVSAKDGDDIITGGSGDDTLNGAVGNDTIAGGAGNDTLTGGAGNDILEGGAGADILNGHDDTDTLTYANSGSAVTVDIGLNTASGGDAAADVISNFENLTGSAYNDTLIGGYGANTINGGAGNDIIIGDSASFINSSVAGIELWLDGNDLSTITKSGVNVSQWSDKSDQSNDATQGGTDAEKPDFVYRSGRGAMQFNDTDSYFSADGAGSVANSEHTVFIVMESAATQNDGGNFMAFNDSGTGDVELWRIKDGTGNILYRDTNTTTISSSDHRGDDTIFTVALDSSTIYPYLNGATLATVAETLDGGATRFSLGHEWDGASSNSNFYNGYIFEVLLVDHKVTSAEQDLIEQYLSYRSSIALSGQSFGVDTLTGGAGADTFTWTNASHSAVGSGNRDIITDFNQGEADKIDLSDFAPTYLGQGAFSGTTNEVRWTQSSGNTLVQIDYNQDGIADIEIELTGLHTLVAGDFIGLNTTDTLTSSIDNLTGDASANIFHATASTYSTSDTLNGAGGSDTLSFIGGATETISSNVSNIETIVLDDNTYDLTIESPVGLTTVDGSALTAGNSLTVNAGDYAGPITLQGGAGADTLTGTSANDAIEGGASGDTLDGGAGTDTLSYASSATAVTVDIGVNTASGGDAAADVIANFENLTGSAYNDTLTGTTAANVLTGGAGDDTIRADSNAFIESGGQIVIEAENFTSRSTGLYSTDAWVIVGEEHAGEGTITNARGGSYIQVMNDDGGLYENNSATGALFTFAPTVRYTVEITTTGVYQLFLNTESISGDANKSDSLYARIVELADGTDGTHADWYDYQNSGDGDFATSPWAVNANLDYESTSALGYQTVYANQGMIWNISTAGTYTIEIAAREDGIALDALVLQLDSQSAPTGAGPSATNTTSTGSTLFGDAGADTLYGYTGADTITGGTGNDIIEGLGGADTLTGSEDDDTFVYSHLSDSNSGSRDNITDFKQGDTGSYSASELDVIDISGFGFDALTPITLLNTSAFSSTTSELRWQTSGSNVLVQLDALGDGSSNWELQLDDMVVGNMNSDQFIFGSVIGSSSGDILNLGNLHHTADGAGGADTITGGTGNDTIKGGAGGDILSGGAGADTLSYAGSASGVTINFATDSASGGDAAGDDITASDFENILGSAQADTLTGDGGANVIQGGAGGDTLSGGAGTDTLSYTNSSAGVTINLATDSASGGDAASDDITASDFENIIGSNSVDTLTGDGGNNVIEGSKGGDTLVGGAGIDTLSYARSKGGVTISLATSTASGGDAAGDDISSADFENISGSYRNDNLTGNSGVNTILGLFGNDTIDGGSGDDTLDGGAGSDTLSYAAHTSQVTVNLATNTATTTAEETDTISNFENIRGGTNTDTLTGDANANTIEGGAGADVLDGAGGEDTLTYINSGSGVTVDIGANTASGGDAASDTISNFEDLMGSNSNDSLTGSSAINVITGLSGNDTIEGGASGDTLDGGAGTDTLSYASSTTAVTVDIGLNTASGGDAASDVISNFENLTGSANNDTLIGGYGANTINGGAGNDIIHGDNAYTTLSGSNLALWLDADDASTLTLDGSNNVSNWANKATGSTNLTASGGAQPLYVESSFSGRGSLYFDGSSDRMLMDDSSGLAFDINDQFTTFVVFERSDNSYSTLYGNIEGSSPYPGWAHVVQTDNKFNTEYWNSDNKDASALIHESTVTLSQDTNYIVTTVNTDINSTGGTNVDIYQNGIVGDTITSDNLTESIASVGDFVVGDENDGEFKFNGYIAEIIIYNDVNVDVTAINQYLSYKYGIEWAGLSFGVDTLTGGTGADTFTWSNSSHSTSASRDMVTDFSGTVGGDNDLIDISTLTSQTLQLSGNVAFTGTANELVWNQSGAHTYVSIDYDGDSTADWEIQLSNFTDSNLGSADFIFGNVTGTSGADTLKLGDGGYTVNGGAGIDTYTGGDGNDTFLLDQNDLVTQNAYDGGAGADMIKFNGDGETLNLTTINSDSIKITNIEEIDMFGPDNTLTLTIDDVIDITDSDNELYVTGGPSDAINASGGWGSSTGTTNYNGIIYDTFTDGTATLYVEQDITTRSIL